MISKEIQADINNKLSPFKNLIAMLKRTGGSIPHSFLIMELQACEASLDYLTNLYEPEEVVDVLEEFEYEMFIDHENTPFEMNTWIPIASDKINKPENIEKYIKDGLLRKIWTSVDEQEPPKHVELLAKAPDGTLYLCGWREAYGIFTIQNKSDNTLGWKWKLVH